MGIAILSDPFFFQLRVFLYIKKKKQFKAKLPTLQINQKIFLSQKALIWIVITQDLTPLLLTFFSFLKNRTTISTINSTI